ncbi:MAG TPA: hypothetical protein VHS28_03595 [Chloroflexota bacterium]|nr:hypothetical protein [Chloroflexota bacterium]
MSEETQPEAQPRRSDDHAGAAANPEQHLLDAHNLSIKVQGKEGTWGRAKWALVREQGGKVKTMAVYEGTRREAANHFFSFIHPNGVETAAPAAPGRGEGYRRGPRPGGRPQGRPAGGRPQGRPDGGRPQGRPDGGRPQGRAPEHS